jgi:uncharacterized protein
MKPDIRYGIVVFRDAMIPMRDGVHLAADIYRPSRDGVLAEGRYPALLVRTPYNKTAVRYTEVADYFTAHGYVTILQDVRGRYQSEGVGQYFHTVNPHEGLDGFDTVEWIAAQDWSNERVGTMGSSYAALVQTFLALQRPPHLTAVWPDVGPTNSYHHQVRMGGAMQLHMFGALFIHALEAPEIRENPTAKAALIDAMERMRDLVYATPFRPSQTALAFVPNLEKTLFDYYWRGRYDEFWAMECSDFERHYERHADVPGVYTAGWYDPFVAGDTHYFAEMKRQNHSCQRLIVGPWAHTSMRSPLSWVGDVDFGGEAVWGNNVYFAEQLRWFDRWLKDASTGVESEPPVRIFVMGGGTGDRTREGKIHHGGHWRAEQEWPLARTQYQNLYLGTKAELAGSPPESDHSVSFLFDPAHPVPTIGGALAALMELVPLEGLLDPFWGKFMSIWHRMRSIVLEGPAHQKEEPGIVGARAPYLPLAMRSDVLVFQTPPLPAPVEVTGALTVKLWISSSAPDTDFTAKLIDVYPPNGEYPAGYHLNLTDSILRIRYREGWDREVMMTPGAIYPIEIVLPPTSNLFSTGHRIRLDISSSNFPRFDINPNTGEPVGRHTAMVAARNTVHLGPAAPSHIVLPVIS